MERRQKPTSPLADRMRPRAFEEFVGQEHIVGKLSLLRRLIEEDNVPSMIFWGPPGTGKTTLAHIIAENTKANMERMSAITGGVDDIKKIVQKAKEYKQAYGKDTILFIDEIHRFNKRQQDALLPHVEDGTLIFIGATTENPSFEVNAALLSRSRVFILNALEAKDVEQVLRRAIKDEERGLKKENLSLNEDVLTFLAEMADGDARVALNALELTIHYSSSKRENGITKDEIKEALQRTHTLYDKGGEEHSNIISALHKSMRGHDADAALYWLGRMLEGGEDPLYIARRIVRFASEDIGIANSFALPQALAAYDACHYIGMPECELALAQAVVYMAKSKKSNALYTAYKNVKKDIRNLPNEPVPLHLRNAPTKLMKKLNYGKGYKYTPDHRGKDAEQDYLPEKLKDKKYLK